MLDNKILYAVTYLFLFGFTNLSYAFTVDFSCLNCQEKVTVPLGASNTMIPAEFFILLFIGFIISLFPLIKNFIHKKPNMSNSMVSTIMILLSCGYFISTAIDKTYKKELVGQYSYENKQLNFVMLNNELINTTNNHKIQAIGRYLYDEQDDIYFLLQNNNFYIVNFDKNTVYKLAKII